MTQEEVAQIKETEEKPKAKKSASKPAEARTLSKDEIIAALKNMTVLELAELVKSLEAEFGVTAAAPAVVAATTSAVAPEAAPPVEEQTEFTVILKDMGPNKINVIKAVREVTSLGLKEAKDLVEGAPKPVKEKASKEEVALVKQKLEAAGATVEIK